MKNSISKSVLAILILGIALIVAILWLNPNRPRSSEPTHPVAEQASPKTNPPTFLLKQKATAAKPVTVAADADLPPVIPISLLKTLSEDAAYHGSAMAALPSGTQHYGGIEFWLQGILRLQGTGTRDFESSHFRTNVVVPLDVTNEVDGNVVVNERGKDIAVAYILGGSLYSSEKSHEKIAEVIWHYEDGTSASPLEANLHLRDWVRQAYEQPERLPNSLTKVAWRGPHPTRKDVTLRLYRIGFLNPHPEKTVRALEFSSTMKKPSLFVAALTLDPLLPGQRTDYLTSDEFPDPELHGQLQLFVQDKDGYPLPNAEVRSGFNAWNRGSPARNTTTDASGGALIRYDDGADTFEVNADAEGYSGRMMLWNLKDGDKVPASYTLKLSPDIKLGGFVVNTENLPVAGASVTVSRFWRGPVVNEKGEQGSFSRQALTTDAEGRWLAKGLTPQLLESIGINVSHPDYISADGVMGVSGTVEQQLRAGSYKTVLQRGQSVRGRVLDASENPVTGATVWAGRKYDRDRKSVKSDAEGHFSFGNIRPADVLFAVLASGFSPASKTLSVKPDMAEIVFRLKAGSVIRAHVQDESAQPIAGVRVSLEGNYGNPAYDAYEFSATTDANGDFSWDSAPNDSMTFYIGKTGYEQKRNVKLLPNQDNIVTLGRPRTLQGLVVNASTEEAVTNFSIRTGTSSGDGQNIYGVITRKQFSPADGRFSMELSEADDNALAVYAEGYADKIESFSEAQNGIVQVTVRMKPTGTLTGVVVGPDGKPAPGVTVSALEGKSNNSSIQLVGGRLRSYGEPNKVTVSDDQGRFKISSPPESGVVVAAGDAGFTRADLAEVRNSGIIQLEAWGRIEGVLKIGGQAGVGKDLLFTLEIPGVGTDFNAYKVTTDEQGQFTMDKIPPGAGSIVRLIKTAPTSWSHSDKTAVTVKAGETTEVSLGDNGAVIVGRINHNFQPTNDTPLSLDGRLSSATPMPTPPKFNSSAEAQAFFNSPEWRALASQRKYYALEIRPDGTFTVDNVAPGDYSLTISIREGGRPLLAKSDFGSGFHDPHRARLIQPH